MKILIAVSGTGGHVYPGIAVAEELRARHPDLSILFATAKGKPGAEWIERAGFRVHPVPIRGVARRPSLTWLALPFWIAAGCVATLSLLLAESPSLVVGTGGYVSGPVVAFASLLRIPTMVLEQNAIPGVATWLGSLVAREVHVSFPETRERLPRRGRVVVSGNPVRRSVERGDAGAFRRALQLPERGELVLVMGGSQGARAVTAAAIDAAKEIGARATFAMLVQAGARGIDEGRRRAEKAPDWLRVVDYVDDVGGAYAACALFVGRAGATTLAELAACGVPSILVPFPYAAEDHQTTNARRLEASGAARVIPERELDPRVLANAIEELMSDGESRARMKDAVRRAGFGGARERVAAACETLLGLG